MSKQYYTKILKADAQSIKLAGELIKNGELVGIPTETVYGLAGNALNSNSSDKIFLAKGRPSDNPLIVHITELNDIYGLVSDFPVLAQKCAEKFWPGPLTMILPKKDVIPSQTSGGLDTVGIRIPSDITARAIIKAAGVPVAAPSANLSGSPSPTEAVHVYDDLKGKIPLIIDGEHSVVGVESTVISFLENGIHVLRPGFISPEDLTEVTPNVTVDDGVIHMLAENAVVKSPGMKYRHYSPNADVIILDGDLTGFNRFICNNADENDYCMIFDDDILKSDNQYVTYGKDSTEQAIQLFSVLRKLDELKVKKVYARCPNRNGVGLAVYNRLLRAAGFQVIKV
ncbi:MAG: threonylcarbamoyl-AMP synthase [Clostridiales bacterium]|nr:threonylcarbamoyl-AMP synthase [Clostridiales bacterium]